MTYAIRAIVGTAVMLAAGAGGTAAWITNSHPASGLLLGALRLCG